jgi:hypothetical protein
MQEDPGSRWGRSADMYNQVIIGKDLRYTRQAAGGRKKAYAFH